MEVIDEGKANRHVAVTSMWFSALLISLHTYGFFCCLLEPWFYVRRQFHDHLLWEATTSEFSITACRCLVSCISFGCYMWLTGKTNQGDLFVFLLLCFNCHFPSKTTWTLVNWFIIGFIPPVVPEQNRQDKWRRFLQARCSCGHPTYVFQTETRNVGQCPTWWSPCRA